MLTTKGRYAVMAMVEIALAAERLKAPRPVSLAWVSERGSIPLNYLEQLFVKLKAAGLVSSVKGPGGGYMLGRPPEQIFVSDIIAAVEESIKMTRCENGAPEGCLGDKGRCVTHDLWEGLGRQIESYLSSISLAHMCVKNQEVPA